jgi:flagellar hook-basal body complex protein FliE
MSEHEHEHEAETAQEAFARVEGELALLRRAVERMAIERTEPPEQPDYSETLAGMVQKIDATLHRADALAKAAKEGVSPRHVVDRIVAAGGDARAEDRRTITTAAAELKDATRALHGVVASARRGDEQNRWLMWSAIGGLVLGMMFWVVFAGIVARAVPTSWQWPEKMAARTLDMPMWEGGLRMMQAASPGAFAALAAGDRVVAANRETLEACQKRADRAREAVQCTIKVRSSEKSK